MVRKSREGDTVKGRVDTAVAASPYVLIMRGPDGRPRTERFKDAAAYRVRLAALQPSDRAVLIEEIFELLEI